MTAAPTSAVIACELILNTHVVRLEANAPACNLRPVGGSLTSNTLMCILNEAVPVAPPNLSITVIVNPHPFLP